MIDLQDPNEETRNQWNIFNENKTHDFEDFCHKFENIESELYDPKVTPLVVVVVVVVVVVYVHLFVLNM